MWCGGWQEGSLAEGSVGFSLGTHLSCRHKSPCRLGLSVSPAKWGRLVWSHLAHTDSKKQKTRTKQTNPLGLTFENPRFHIKVGIFPLSRKIGIFGHITASWQQLAAAGQQLAAPFVGCALQLGLLWGSLLTTALLTPLLYVLGLLGTSINFSGLP